MDRHATRRGPWPSMEGSPRRTPFFALIRLQAAAVVYGAKRALDGIGLQVGRGESISIIGPSGCGKTSLLRVIAGLVPISSGTIEIGEAGIVPRIALMFQGYALFPWLRAVDNAALGLYAAAMEAKAARAKARSILADLGIQPDEMERFPAELSGGQAQRVALGRALAIMPDILLLDEPTSSLDAKRKEEAQDIIVRMREAAGSTMITATHGIEEAVSMAGRIYSMRDGRIVDEIANPLFGVEGAHARAEFYELCRRVRNMVVEGPRQ